MEIGSRKTIQVHVLRHVLAGVASSVVLMAVSPSGADADAAKAVGMEGGAITVSASPADADLANDLGFEGSAVWVPRPTYSQIYTANVGLGGIGPALSAPEKLDRELLMSGGGVRIHIGFGSPNRTPGDRWRFTLRGVLMEGQVSDSTLTQAPGGLVGAVITQPITGGTTSTAAGAGAEAYVNDTLTQYDGSVFYLEGDARMSRLFVRGSVTVETGIGITVWQFKFDERIRNTDIIDGAFNTLNLKTSSFNVGPTFGIGVTWKTRLDVLTIRFNAAVTPYHANLTVRGNQGFTSGVQGGNSLSERNSDNLWGVRGTMSLGLQFRLARQVDFAVVGRVDFLSDIPVARVPNSTVAPRLHVGTDSSQLPSVTGVLRVRF